MLFLFGLCCLMWLSLAQKNWANNHQQPAQLKHTEAANAPPLGTEHHPAPTLQLVSSLPSPLQIGAA